MKIHFEERTKKLVSFIKYIMLDSIASSHCCPQKVRNAIYKSCGHKIEGTIYPECFLGAGPKGKLFIGKGSYCNYRCFFDLGDDIVIGEKCAIAFGVTFVNSYHMGGKKQRAAKGCTGRIEIKDGCWIGANVTILPNVTIHEGCIIGAGTIVVKDCDANGLYVGAPAKRIKDL